MDQNKFLLLQKLKLSLDDLQTQCIGLFNHLGYNDWEMVIDKDGDVLTTISLGFLGGYSTLTISANEGTYLPFPDNLNLYEFKNQHYRFAEWCTNNKVTS